jgi:hypothetical protein
MADDSTAKNRGIDFQWTTVIITILTWLMSAALTYGIVSTKINYLEERVSAMERRLQDVTEHYITREEYQRLHSEMEKKMIDGDKELRDRLDTLILMHTDDSRIRKK